ncbi:MAG: 2-dehydropantoate 2-reductase [Gammaproteobacteria bacterium]
MQFTIVGAGALGTILGAHLAEAGHEVRMVARGERARTLAADGLRVSGLRELTQPCSVTAAPEPGRDEDVLVYAVKTYHMEQALAAARGITPRAVFSLANGVLKNEQLATTFGAAHVLGCMANFSGELRADGSALFTRNVMLHLGGDAATRAITTEIAAAIDTAGIRARAVDDIETVEWSKFVGWVALFALAVIARSPTGRALDNPHFAQIGAAVVREAAAIAAARDITLVDQSPLPVASIAAASSRDAVALLREVGRDFARDAPEHRMSALQDLAAGRRLEVHETLGYAVREAARLGVNAPTLALCYAIGAGLDALDA